VGPTLTVSVEPPPTVMNAGLKETVGPSGLTLALTYTVPALPAVRAVEIVLVPLDPCWILRVLGVALMEKSLTGVLHPANWNDPTRVFQLKEPSAGMYWFVYQKVQSSKGSTDIAL